MPRTYKRVNRDSHHKNWLGHPRYKWHCPSDAFITLPYLALRKGKLGAKATFSLEKTKASLNLEEKTGSVYKKKLKTYLILDIINIINREYN